MSINKVVEYVFFFLLLAISGYLVWQVMAPFVSALALSVIIVTVCYPLYEVIQKFSYKNNKTIAASITTLGALFAVILPLVLISVVFVRELMSFYQAFGVGQELSVETYILNLESTIKTYVPEFEFSLTEQIKQSAGWLAKNIGAIFAGTISTFFIIMISLIGSFYFFRDGKEFVKMLIKISPLPEKEDEIIISRLALAVRSVVTGVVLLSIIQGVLAAIGFTIFGIDRAVLWGAVGAIISMLPGIGSMAVMIPGVAFLFFTGSVMPALGLAVWTIVMVVVVDNIIGPNLMNRGNNLHPFIVLISVLGGVSTFGPLGFIVGPVIVTLFIVLLEVYNQYIAKEKGRAK